MDTTQQQYMVALAETGSITNAAKFLGVSQPAISNWLKNTEEQLGIQLVIRSKKSIVLTPAGKIYLDGARKMIDIKNKTYHAINTLAGNEKESIVISGTPNGGAELYATIYQRFKNNFPSISLQFIENYNSNSLDCIKNGSADLAFCTVLDYDTDNFIYVPTVEREIVIMVPYNFPMAYDASNVKPKDPLPALDFEKVKDLPFILPGPEMSYYSALNRYFQNISFQPRVVFQSSNAKAIYNMVKNGNGIGIVNRRFFTPLDRIAPYSFDPPMIAHSSLVYKKDRIMTPAFESFVQALTTMLTIPS